MSKKNKKSKQSKKKRKFTNTTRNVLKWDFVRILEKWESITIVCKRDYSFSWNILSAKNLTVKKSIVRDLAKLIKNPVETASKFVKFAAIQKMERSFLRSIETFSRKCTFSGENWWKFEKRKKNLSICKKTN